MKEYEVRIEGITPLLFNRFIEAEIATDVKKRAGSPKPKKVEDKLYKLPNGKIYTPASHIRGMLINSAKNFKIRGKGRATYSKLIGSIIEVRPEAIVHEYQEWKPFTVSAVNPNTKGRMMVTRPRMDKWALTFHLIFPEEDISPEVIKAILDYGGRYVGIGDWRPAKKGMFGKFIVTKFEEVK